MRVFRSCRRFTVRFISPVYQYLLLESLPNGEAIDLIDKQFSKLQYQDATRIFVRKKKLSAGTLVFQNEKGGRTHIVLQLGVRLQQQRHRSYFIDLRTARTGRP